MNKKKGYIGLVLLAGLLLSACSTQKNTWASRTFHGMKVRYNILYNGTVAYEEGLKAIQEANEDDYSQVLPLYPVSNHKAAQASASKMDRTIEKCRKCIKLHSIKKGPQKKNPKRMSDPKYKAWLQQTEFNEQMRLAWMRLGEAEFHKGDFLGAVGTFSYVQRLYSWDADMVAQAQLWTARAYAEMGWLYEADDMLHKVNMDALSRKHARLYAAVSADVLLKTEQYKAALPYVQIAVPNEKRKIYRPRFEYVLGQLLEKEGRRQDAVSAYKRVVRLAPAPVMDFNARIRMAELKGGERQLKQMTRQSKYKDRLDRIYTAMGNIRLEAGDTAKALQYYRTAIDTAKQAMMDKATVLVKAGDLYYGRKAYESAQPCYQEAVTILTNEHPDFERVQRRSEVLDELVLQVKTVQLQDSLQRLGKLPIEEQEAVVARLIEALIAKEKADSAQAALAEREAQNGNGLQSVNTANMLGGSAGASAAWYFYNPQLMRQGKQLFQQQWGTRPLEDNWRRKNKAMSSSWMGPEPEEEPDLETDSLQTDSVRNNVPVLEMDEHKPAFYLQQIPKTEEDYANSDSLIRGAMVQMVYIYKDRMEEPTLAEETLAELQKRFPGHTDLKALYYMYYLDCLKRDDQTAAAVYRDRILRDYPESQEAYIVSQPDYFERLRHMAQEQDSIYGLTYEAYKKGDFATVKRQTAYAEEAWPLSPLMPRFLFLNAIARARTEGQDAFVASLRDMVSRYPENPLGAMAKDMLAMMGQGMESQEGGATSSLAELRGATAEEEEKKDEEEKTWSAERVGSSVVLMVLPEMDENVLNRLQYEVALFNFSQFLIKDFDLQKMPVFGKSCALRVIGFESMEEALWWMGLANENAELQQVIRTMDVRLIPITEENLPLLNTHYSVDEYLEWLKL